MGRVRVLVAVSDPAARQGLKSLVSRWGHEVTTAADGNEAWAALEPKDGPKLALLDAGLAGMDGTEVCARVRARGAPHVYLMMIAPRERRAELMDLLDGAADDVLAAPVDEEDLRARLRIAQRILKLQESLLEAQHSLRYRASHDLLTGSANRWAILEDLERELYRASRDGGWVGVVLMDLDRLGSLNAAFGDTVGDTVLRETVQRVRTTVRPYDGVGRYGDGEFLLVFPGCDRQATAAVAERVREQLAASPIEFGTSSVRVTASLGVAAVTPGGDNDAQGLIRAADMALDRAKQSGRNRVEVAADANVLDDDEE